jgi:hypothetical protein
MVERWRGRAGAEAAAPRHRAKERVVAMEQERAAGKGRVGSRVRAEGLVGGSKLDGGGRGGEISHDRTTGIDYGVAKASRGTERRDRHADGEEKSKNEFLSPLHTF